MGALAIFPMAAGLAVVCKRKFEETIFPSIALIIFTLMCTGMVGYLKAGICVVWGYVSLAMITLIVKRRMIKKYVLTSGAFAFAFFYIYFMIFSYGRGFSSDVAYSQYGPVVRNMCRTGSLKADVLYYSLHTPFPFATLWAYFCTETSGGFSEGICILANDVFIIAALLPLFRNIKSVKNDFGQWLFTCLICILLPIFKIPEAYSSFDMAVPQAVAMLYALMMCYSVLYRQKKIWTDVVFAAIGFFAACTLTSFGAVEAIPLIMGVCAVAFINKKKRIYLLSSVGLGGGATLIWSVYKYIYHEINLSGVCLTPAVCVGAMLAAAFVTGLIRLYDKGYRKAAVMIGALVFICVILGVRYAVFHGKYEHDYVIEMLIEYTNKLSGFSSEEESYVIGRHMIKIYDASFLIIAVIVAGLACRKAGNNRKVYVFNFAVCCGTVLYLMVLAVQYVNIIKIPDAYPNPTIAAYMVPVLMLAFVSVYSEALKVWKKERVMLAAVAFLVICVYGDPISATYRGRNIAGGSAEGEMNWEYPLIAACKKEGLVEFNGNDRIFYIDKDLLEPVPSVFKWEVFPAGADAISGLNYKSDPYKWSNIEHTMYPEEMAALLAEGEYTYVYIKNIDDFFIETYYPNFDNWGSEIMDDALYRVEYDDEGQLQIKYIAGLE